MSNIQNTIKEKYAAVADSNLTNHTPGVQAIAQAFGYSAEELASIPAQANMGLSCGNPIATANLKPGEVVVDLGSGGGLDVFLASQKVGPSGKAIGIDMTPSMITRATKAAQDSNFTNVQFHLATIDNLPLPSNSVNCVTSNCVINLAPDKPAVFKEIFRILKPGGRVALSDIALKKSLPPDLAASIMALVGCISGAVPIDTYRKHLQAAGFSQVLVIDSNADLNAYANVDGQTACCSPPMESKKPLSLTIQPEPCCGPSCCSPAEKTTTTLHEDLSKIITKYNLNDFAASIKVFALKPG